MGHFNVQNLANTAWAFATAGWSDPHLFTALARAAEQRMHDFNEQDLANAVWAFAIKGRSDAQPAQAVARAAEQHAGYLNRVQHDSLKSAWSLFDHAKFIVVSSSPLCSLVPSNISAPPAISLRLATIMRPILPPIVCYDLPAHRRLLSSSFLFRFPWCNTIILAKFLSITVLAEMSKRHGTEKRR